MRFIKKMFARIDPIKACMNWQRERGLDKKRFDLDESFERIFEELLEIRGFTNKRIIKHTTAACLDIIKKTEEDNKITRGKYYDIIDGLCDICVFAEGDMLKLSTNPKIARYETWKEISSRTGSFNKLTGKWEKDKKQKNLYKADYYKSII